MDDVLVRLRRLDSCAVSDALDKLGLEGRVTSALPQRASTKRISGRIVTVRLGVASAGPSARHLGTTAIENAIAGDIVVIEQRTGIEAGSWGGILTLGAKLRGIAGAIVDGPVRDIDEARGHDFPIYSRGLTARTARGRIVELETGGAVVIDGIDVEPTDYVVADASGVAFIAAGNIARVLEAAEAIAAREALMTKALLAGHPITSVMGADYETMARHR